MIDTPEITETAVQLAAIIRLTIPREEIRSVMGPGIGEVMAAGREKVGKRVGKRGRSSN